MKKKLNHKKPLVDQEKKVFSSPIHHEKNQKNEKTKKKKIEILFGRPNSSTVFKFSRKIKSKKTFSENHKMAARVSSIFISPSNYPRENKILTPSRELFMYYFRVPPP